jgi:proline iminopeptidase
MPGRQVGQPNSGLVLDDGADVVHPVRFTAAAGSDNEVLANMARIAHIPATLIHGLHDVSGPLDTAWELHKAWPASRLVVVDDAGHFGGSMGEQFTTAIDAMADQLHPA